MLSLNRSSRISREGREARRNGTNENEDAKSREEGSEEYRVEKETAADCGAGMTRGSGGRRKGVRRDASVNIREKIAVQRDRDGINGEFR